HDNLTVNCKDKRNDLGVHTLKAEETYTFIFRPNLFFNVTLYFCRFVWIGVSHYFDIYRQDRDKCVEYHWDIFERGPCKIYPKNNECFLWNN
ncbi:hypothetical protein PHAVU_004G004400, partial [Phaseolus vulgaris]